MLLVKKKKEPSKYAAFSEDLTKQVDVLQAFQLDLCVWCCEVEELKADEPDDTMMLELTTQGKAFKDAADGHLLGAKGGCAKYKGVLNITNSK
jgi:hypothetical protein